MKFLKKLILLLNKNNWNIFHKPLNYKKITLKKTNQGKIKCETMVLSIKNKYKITSTKDIVHKKIVSTKIVKVLKFPLNKCKEENFQFYKN